MASSSCASLDYVTVGALTTTYGVNGLGERVAKDGQQAFGKVEFVYGLSGGLLGQYNASGAAAEEIVWLGDLPVGTIQGGAAYHIAPDHLGAPHQIVNSANGQVWFWNHDPFGNGAPTAVAGFAHRLRFPGQVHDAESGLHSNGHRDYDPRLGRYVESDPIGLAGGINTYAYGGNNPVNAIDPRGLDPKVKKETCTANRARHEQAVAKIGLEYLAAGKIVTPNVTFTNPKTGARAVADLVISNPAFPVPAPFLIIEVKTGGGQLERGQPDVYGVIKGSGGTIVPRGFNALRAGFIPGVEVDAGPLDFSLERESVRKNGADECQ
jgi:RHS repeat-associated protein